MTQTSTGRRPSHRKLGCGIVSVVGSEAATGVEFTPAKLPETLPESIFFRFSLDIVLIIH
jgi:hypothetical protein